MIVQPYINFIQPDAGGNVKPVSKGKVYIGIEGLDPKSGGNPIYYRDNQGVEKEMPNPINLNMTGVPVAGINDSTIVSPYTKKPISILIENKNGDAVYSELQGVTQMATQEELNLNVVKTFNSVSDLVKFNCVLGSTVNLFQFNLLISNTSDAQSIQLENGLYAIFKPSGKLFEENFGGIIFEDSTQVALGKIYFNAVESSDTYKSYLYFDAPEMPISPVAFSASYGGSLKNGVFGQTQRSGDKQKSYYGYRAGLNAKGFNDVFIGPQAGEDSDSSTAPTFDKGNLIGLGVLAFHDAIAYSSVAAGTEAGNHFKGGRSAFYGSFSGNSAECLESGGYGWRSAEKFVGKYSSFMGNQSGFEAAGDYLLGCGYNALLGANSSFLIGLGDYALGNATGKFQLGIGSRVLSGSTGTNNAAAGYQAAYTGTADPWTASNVALWGHRAGYKSNTDGNTGIGREACSELGGSYNFGGGYRANVGHNFSRTSAIGQSSNVTGNDQIQLGAPDTTVYAFGSVQDRSDERDKTDFKPISNGLKGFFFDVEFQTYRFDYRDAYIEHEEVQVGIDPETAEPIFETRIKQLPKDGSKAGARHHAGVVAQQVKRAMDKHGVDFGGYQDHKIKGGKDVLSIGYQQFIPIIGAIVQDHEKKVIKLEDKVSSLEETLRLLTERLEKAGI